jgi:hypothetical protein
MVCVARWWFGALFESEVRFWRRGVKGTKWVLFDHPAQLHRSLSLKPCMVRWQKILSDHLGTKHLNDEAAGLG